MSREPLEGPERPQGKTGLDHLLLGVQQNVTSQERRGGQGL